MKLTISQPFWQVLSLGLLAGMRTASAPAITSHILSRHRSGRLAGSPLKLMQFDKVAMALKVFAVVEFVGDKLPVTPNRIKSSSLIARCLSGSLAGASIYKANGKNAIAGALLGSATAFGATFGSYFLRKGIVRKIHIFDPILGVVEDAVVIGAGIGLVSEA